MAGPLQGVRIIEVGGIGPGPFCAMMLSDMGADVVRVDRAPGPGARPASAPRDVLSRGRRSIALDLKNPRAAELLLRGVERADGLVEGFRPGVTERLGIGPDPCLARNPRLVYGRMTGWGQSGPLAQAAGHDINYIALAGALEPIGTPDKPIPPLNLVGDFGGGGMLLAFGMVCGILEARASGRGQVVDAAMVDGAAALMGMMQSMLALGSWREERGTNLLDGGAHFYDTYECRDGKFVSVGAIERPFYRELLERLGLEGEELPKQMDRETWPSMREKFAALFRTKSRAEWCELLEGSDVCFAPVLAMSEAPGHPHNRERGTFLELDGMTQPAPAPRFSRTAPPTPGPPAAPGQHTEQVLDEWGLSEAEVAELRDCGAVA